MVLDSHQEFGRIYQIKATLILKIHTVNVEESFLHDLCYVFSHVKKLKQVTKNHFSLPIVICKTEDSLWTYLADYPFGSEN